MKNVTYINAGAGSGKTHRLTETLTQLIKEKKVKPDQVILTTFTTKAANEFKEKAKVFLFDAGLYDEAVQLDHAMIGTVHSVCQRMIGKYWFNIGLSPNMGVMAEEDTTFYISQSLAELPTEEELKLLRDFARYFDLREKNGYISKKTINYDFWQEHLKSVIGYATNYELDDFARSEKESLNFVSQFVTNDTNFNFTDGELKNIVDEQETFLRGYRQSGANDQRLEKLKHARRSLDKPTLGTLGEINSTIGTPKGYGPLASDFKNRMAYIWTSKMVCDKQKAYISLLFKLALRWKENFVQFKREKNLLDYDDMEKYMRLLLQDDTIKSEISQSFRYLFVDEFQDSSPIQVKIFDALSDLMEHSYWVGDYKQAIYGFRGSDIALTKAVVDQVSKKKDGCDTDTLGKSWRSLPDIVDLNNAVFEKTFAGVLEQKNIHLDKTKENENNEDSLRYFVSRNDEGLGVADHVLKLLHLGAKPNEIAVLARNNDTLAKLAVQLKQLNIPASREDCPVTGSAVYPLVQSLLRIIDNSNDTLSKAIVAILTERDYNTRQIIESKILIGSDESVDSEDFLADIPLISQLLAIQSNLKQQSVASLVESMIIELNLYDVVKRIPKNDCDDPAFCISCLQKLIETAHVYEEHCVQMNLPATIDGYIAYVEAVAPVGNGNPDGVQLHTYHSCKGLQWKYVILMSFNKNEGDLKKAVNRETYGVHVVHSVEPTMDNPYPEVYIRLTPWVYGTAAKVPDEISARIEESDGFKLAYKAMLAEANRLLYVGMTRPADVLIIAIESDRNFLLWPKNVGMNTVSDTIPESGSWDVFGTGHHFSDFSITEKELDILKPFGDVDETLSMALNIGKPTFGKHEPRFISPSGISSKGNVASYHDFEKRIPFGEQTSDMAVVGNCIHQIFAGIEEPGSDKIDMATIIDSYGLSAVLTNKESIARAWTNLSDYLTSTFGAAVKTFHERPFRMDRDGQTIVGSIDLVWQTANGDILIDFKTCPMGLQAILDPESDYYAGKYAGQLDAYTNALVAAGEKVIKRYIYYPVSGLLVEIE
ncbi:MAG: UvrD-helicase domain-containing protein [Salinivirgaceae bacterium]|nr:UvrD-helicase domain-containing protein [Salinivirgaceae bacterium]